MKDERVKGGQKKRTSELSQWHVLKIGLKGPKKEKKCRGEKE